MESGRNGTKPSFPEQPSIASLFPAGKSDSDASSEYDQIPPAKMESGRNGTKPSFPEQPSIASLFPAGKSDSDASSEYNQIPLAKMESGRNGTKPSFPEQPSIASLFPADKSDGDASLEYNQIPPAKMESGRNGTKPSFPEQPSIASLFPADKSDSDASSEYNKIPPNFSHHNSNYIDPFFTSARSETDEIIIRNSTLTQTSFLQVIPSSIGPTIQISIPSRFAPNMFDTEIDGSASSECNEAQPRVFDSIVSFFPRVRSPSNVSKISETTLDHSMASIFPADTIFNSYVFQQFFRSVGKPFKTTMEDALEALKDNNNNIDIVGIYGDAGVGKTTMVKQVAEMVMIEGLFHRVVMATVSKPVNLNRIQSSIADGLELLLKKESNRRRAKELRKKIMADKRILVILDDVWEWIDLSRIGIPIGSDLEACKSKILLTTRQERVCKLMGCEENRIHLNSLFPEDSWDPPEFEAVACKIGAKCQASLRVLWNELIMALREYERSVSPNPDLPEKVKWIKLSYDFLKNREAKACFLMCCLFPVWDGTALTH